MRIGILGTGMVGRTLSDGLASLGHEVVLGTRDPAETRERTRPDQYGFALAPWFEANPQIRLATFADAAAQSEIVVNATAGIASLDVLGAAGAANLDGKILIDVANALDFSRGMPPSLKASTEDSLAERIQAAFPGARVVKTLNTVGSSYQTRPMDLAEGDHSTFVCGNDEAAKATVTELLRSLGWRDIIDLGDLRAARATEMVMPLWIALLGALGLPPKFQFKVVR